MAISLAGFGGFLQEFLYRDSLDIYRYTEVTQGDGTTHLVMPSTPLYSGIACRISIEQPDSSAFTADDLNRPHLNAKLFCSTTVDIRKGDRVIVKRYNPDESVLATYEGNVGLPFKYPTHQEISLQDSRLVFDG